MTPEERLKLTQAARDAAGNAYAPYSHFRVGAAVLGKLGMYTGVNVENASYPTGLCAERAALAAAIAKGDRTMRGIAIACVDATTTDIHELVPCGACRQWMTELAPNAEVVVCGSDLERNFTVAELLPLPFRLKEPAP
jgi:cytidine deaminase